MVPGVQEAIDRKIMIQVSPRQKHKTLSKNKLKRKKKKSHAGGMAQVAKNFPCKHKALSSNPVPPKRSYISINWEL
jgi:hypothetical protein